MHHQHTIRTLALSGLLLAMLASRAQEKSGTHENTVIQPAGAKVAANLSQHPNDWEDPERPSQGTLAPHAHFTPYPDAASALRGGSSPLVLSLNGVWKFHMAENPDHRPAAFYKDSFDVSGWKTIHVPANWQVEGYDKFIFTDVEYPITPNPPYVPADYNPVGSYRRDFNLPADWQGRKIILHLGAVNSFFYCWVNGKCLGFSKDSKTPAEFDITAAVRPGANTVAIQVFRFSDGTYLEGQDMWKLSGIERDVYLVARPRAGIYDYWARAGLDSLYKDGIFDLTVTMDHAQAPAAVGTAAPTSGTAAPVSGARPAAGRTSLRITLKDDANGGKPVYSSQQPLQDGQPDYHFNTRIPGVRKWNAEQPNLYTLLIEQLDAKGQVIEALVSHPGFRSIEIRHGLFLVNGVAVKIKGVNRHEHDMYTGKVITEESMVNDIRLFKQYNINAMRCSHYPNREEWYENCDKYGIYLIDEANIECDGMSMLPSVYTLSDKPAWKQAYMDRTRRMFERDKNHCSIITWSLGNESRFGDNFIATYQFLKSKDPSRPVQYEEARDNPYTDIICPMYKSLYVMQDYVREWRPRPFIQVEYAHMMGNSGGNLKDDWDLIYKYPQLQGGFIWDFCDQTFKRKDSKGRYIWAYGRDMGMVGSTSDTSFCADGMFAADRTPHPQAFEMRKVYQYAAFSPVDFTRWRIGITNRFDFTDLDQYRFRWYIKADGQRIAGGDLPVIQLAPHASTEIDLPVGTFPRKPGVEYFLYVEGLTARVSPLIPAGTVMAWEQFELLPAAQETHASGPTTAKPGTLKQAAPLTIEETNDQRTVRGDDFAVAFDRHSGWLTQLINHGQPMLKAPLQPDFDRAATDNDIGNSQQIRCAVWARAMEGARLDSFTIGREGKTMVRINAVYYLPTVDAQYRMVYRINGEGRVNIEISMKAGPQELPEMPRFGMALILDPAFENVRWLGRGPFDNYEDRKYAAAVDVYAMKADSLFHPYPRAQESGYRTDIRWMSLLNAAGKGLRASGSPRFSAGVIHFDRTRMLFDRDAKENVHGGSMSNDDLILWNIDYKQEGVGGDNAWGAQTHSEYVLPYGDYQYRFNLQIIK